MMNRGKRSNSEAAASGSLPSIGCYVKDEFAEEYHIAPSSERYIPQTSKKTSFGRFWFGLTFFMIIGIGLFFGFRRHIPDDFAFISVAQDYGQRLVSLVQFPIKEVHIAGHKFTKEKAIVERLGDVWEQSLVSLNTFEAQRKIESLPWILRADVQRVFPHGLNIYVEERQPIGRFVTLSGTYVFDKLGVVIEKVKVGSHFELPIYEGSEAPKVANELREILTKFDDLQPLIVRFRRVDQRRWTLILHNEMKVLLPENGIEGALSRLRALQAQHNILNRELAHIDLRIGDRITLRPKKSKNIKIFSRDEDFSVGKMTGKDKL